MNWPAKKISEDVNIDHENLDRICIILRILAKHMKANKLLYLYKQHEVEYIS